MVLRNGINVSRRVVGNYSNNNIGEDLRNQRLQGAPPTIQRGVVTDVICDPSDYTEDELQALAERVSNPEVVDVMPINSVVARIITNGQDISNPTETIFFPFYPSNFQMPVVPGEQICILYEDYSQQRGTVGYWITRPTELKTVEDINYTHADRKYQGFLNPQNISTDLRGRPTYITQSFPNGGNNPDTYTLRITGSNGENPYDAIIKESKASRYFTFEPVPRYKKAPGDFVLQGKNNATIILGTDRNGPLNTFNRIEQAGAVDIVAGRARILPGDDGPNTGASQPTRTAPWITKNSRGFREVNKAPYIYQGTKDRENEGYADLKEDAARLLVTMQSEVDKNFLLLPGNNLTYPQDTIPIVQPKLNTSGTFGKSYVAAKADNIRLIARYSEELGITGSILIIREGNDENNLGYIYINDQSNIQIMGPKIFIGRSTGADTNNNEPPEPYIKWTEFKKTVDYLQKEIDDLRTNLQSQITAVGNSLSQTQRDLQIAFQASIAIPYNPIASLNAVAPNLQVYGTDMISKLNTKQQESQQIMDDGKNNTDTSVENSKSKRIFGE